MVLLALWFCDLGAAWSRLGASVSPFFLWECRHDGGRSPSNRRFPINCSSAPFAFAHFIEGFESLFGARSMAAGFRGFFCGFVTQSHRIPWIAGSAFFLVRSRRASTPSPGAETCPFGDRVSKQPHSETERAAPQGGRPAARPTARSQTGHLALARDDEEYESPTTPFQQSCRMTRSYATPPARNYRSPSLDPSSASPDTARERKTMARGPEQAGIVASL